MNITTNGNEISDDIDDDIDLESAFEILKLSVKKSVALDQARHFDFTLIPAAKRGQCIKALKRVQQALRNKEITQEYFEKKTTLKKL